jgi:hypothetical protein
VEEPRMADAEVAQHRVHCGLEVGRCRRLQDGPLVGSAKCGDVRSLDDRLRRNRVEHGVQHRASLGLRQQGDRHYRPAPAVTGLVDEVVIVPRASP